MFRPFASPSPLRFVDFDRFSVLQLAVRRTVQSTSGAVKRLKAVTEVRRVEDFLKGAPFRRKVAAGRADYIGDIGGCVVDEKGFLPLAAWLPEAGGGGNGGEAVPADVAGEILLPGIAEQVV